ncbi:MAG: RNA polymerase sigma factor [Myxococcales bacterium]|nr:RNA polymerase sigma factor [Myxococcales bacterium]
MFTQTSSFTAPPTPRPLRDEIAELMPALRARALKLSLNATDAQDLVQDTVERALKFETSYQPGTNLRAWLQQVLFSVFVTRCRRLRRERRALESLTHDPCAWTQSESSPVMQHLSPQVERALGELPRAFGEVVRLVDLDERSYKDAAAVLGVPVGTVMSRLFRGRRLLAERLREAPEPMLAEAA